MQIYSVTVLLEGGMLTTTTHVGDSYRADYQRQLVGCTDVMINDACWR